MCIRDSENMDRESANLVGYDTEADLDGTVEFMKRAIEGTEEVTIFPIISVLHEIEVGDAIKTVAFTGAVFMPDNSGNGISPYIFCIQPEGSIPMPMDNVSLFIPPDVPGVSIPTGTLRIEDDGKVFVDDIETNESHRNSCDIFDGTKEEATTAMIDGTWPEITF